MVAGHVRFSGGRALLALALAVGLAGCSGLSKPKPEDKAPTDPNAFPADYRAQLVAFLRQSLTDRADFRGAQIAPPVLKPIGDSQHYMACMQFTGRGQPKTKVAIYLYGKMTQFIDATPAQCGDAAYQPFHELETAVPSQ